MTEEDPLLLAKAMLTSESKVEEAFRISMMPWLTFTGVTWLFLYCYAHLPSFVVISLSTWATMCLCTLLAMYLRPKAPAAQGKHGLVVVLSLFSLCLGTVFGYWNYSRAGGVGDYWAIGSHEIYEGVSPSEPADARRDAAALAFTKYSRPDARLSTSYAAFGQKYCVAPVMAMGQEYTGTFAAQYFATGKDCCRDLEFTCGDALDEAAHSGLVIFNKTQTALSWAFAQDLDYFMKAARMASARFGIHLAEEPIFVSWVSDTKTAMANLWPEARNIWLLSSMLALPAFAVISFACEAFKGAGNRFSKEKELP